METFNKSFFRVAFGFIGVIVASVLIIFAVQTFTVDAATSECTIGCEE